MSDKQQQKSNSGGWYNRGIDDEALKKAESERGGGTRRFWMPPNSTRKIIMLDDEPFCIHEHNPKINGQFKDNWYTCRKGADVNDLACPMCSSKVRRYYIGFVTVLDATGWTTKKDNKLVIYQRQLFPMKVESLKRFKIIKHKKTHLVGAIFDVTRTDDRSPQCGDMFDFEGYADLKDEKYFFDSRLEGKKKAPEPFNYLDILKPLSSKEMMAIGIGGDDLYDRSDSSSEDDSAPAGGDEDTIY